MPSQKSRTVESTARQPKRQRGRDRVAVLLDAAASVFGEKGYDAATMTEIAARAKTAIGSLYQFFPGKDALADALLARYVERLREELSAVERRAPTLPPARLADALVDTFLALRADRAAAVALVDARDRARNARSAMRKAMLDRIGSILTAASPSLAADTVRPMAAMVLQLMKLAPGLAADQRNGDLVGELRTVLRLYLADGLRPRSQ